MYIAGRALWRIVITKNPQEVYIWTWHHSKTHTLVKEDSSLLLGGLLSKPLLLDNGSQNAQLILQLTQFTLGLPKDIGHNFGSESIIAGRNLQQQTY